MDFPHLLQHYFGEADMERLDPATLANGLDQIRLDFGLEQDAGRRFGLWALLYMLDAAPDLDVAFKTTQEKDAARNFMDMADRLSAD